MNFLSSSIYNIEFPNILTDLSFLTADDGSNKSNDTFYDSEITYKLNSDGYRCDEFSSIDWENSIVFHGCSNIFGVGNPEEYTIPKLFEKISGIKTVNLGMPGVGADFVSDNILRMRVQNIKPLASIVFWPNPDRFYFSDEKTETLWHVNSNTIEGGYNRRMFNIPYFLNTKNNKHRFVTSVLSSQYYYDLINLTLDITSLEYLNDLRLSNFLKVDSSFYEFIYGHARDGQHYHWKTHYDISKFIYKKINTSIRRL